MKSAAKKYIKLSDEIGKNIYENVTTAVEKSEEFQETHEELIYKNFCDKKEKYKRDSSKCEKQGSKNLLSQCKDETGGNKNHPPEKK